MAASTRTFRSELTFALELMTAETVAMETPANRATSRIVCFVRPSIPKCFPTIAHAIETFQPFQGTCCYANQLESRNVSLDKFRYHAVSSLLETLRASRL